ncbi:hypothetical protein KJ877_01590 [bacterium]|nr:hypothetical protein [bacterium]MBU1989956.1 hypothetical protein [bacterium]
MLKRYSMAFVFLFIVVALMVLGTYGVKSFGDKMFENTDVVMQPRGEKVNK